MLTAGDLTLDPARRRVHRGTTAIELTPREFSLLEYLMRHCGDVVSKTEILRDVWDPHYDGGDNVVEVYVRYLRRKIDAPFDRSSIETVRGADTRDEITRLAETMNGMLARLEAAHVTQRRFVADASHELRSPLATLATSLELAERDRWQISPEHLAGMREEVDRLAGMVDGLLLLARADERGLRPRRAEVDLDDLVDAERTRLRRTTHLTVHADVRPVKIYGDRAALAQVVRNLADNAARYASGIVRLTVTTRDGQAVLEVADDGPGIPAADRDRVFDRFVRLDTARQRSRGGAGLGLAIVREIVSAHGGRIEIVDAPEGGAGFHIVFPVSSRTATSPKTNLVALVVEVTAHIVAGCERPSPDRANHPTISCVMRHDCLRCRVCYHRVEGFRSRCGPPRLAATPRAFSPATVERPEDHCGQRGTVVGPWITCPS